MQVATHKQMSGIGRAATCMQCGGASRPDIVFFEEQYSDEVNAVTRDWLAREYDFAIIIGTSGQISSFWELFADFDRANPRAPIYNINPEHDIPFASNIRLSASEGMKRLRDALGRRGTIFQQSA